MKPAITELPIKTADSGFYDGFNRVVALGSKLLIGLLILWAAVFPEQAGKFLKNINGFVNANFGAWYMGVMALFIVVCFALALWPSTGKLRLGKEDDKPEFSRFSWFSMLFGAGIGIGMMTYAVGEPISQFGNNPDIIRGTVEGSTTEAVRSAYKWTFLHWGLSAWGCYALIGLALGFFAYSRGLPLTIRSALVPLFGRHMSGILGHAVDIIAVIATTVGVAIAVGYGVSQFASGLHNITGADWIMKDEGGPTTVAMLMCLVVIMAASTLSALSGVGRGIKWLSNLNMGLSFFIIAFFVIFGATTFAAQAFFVGIWDYLIALPAMATQVFTNDGTEMGKALAGWQGSWTIFYWAWWIAFAPFVGLFFARISKGRSLREYVFGTMIIPSLMCFVWFTAAGGTAIDLELSGKAAGRIVNADLSAQLFETVNVMLDPVYAKLLSGVIVVLLLTYLVTSADSAVLVINTIAAAGNAGPKASVHIIFWGVALTAVIGVLLLAGGLDAISTAMIIGALPFSIVMALMGIALIKALIRDGLRKRL
ncbi:MAG: BCCT family transporter [Maricaulaceae bacterium]